MKLNQALNKTLKSKDVIDKLATLGAEPGGGTLKRFKNWC
jgi:tripartite-type tricarboxylate transporter receptor subunit TctC